MIVLAATAVLPCDDLLPCEGEEDALPPRRMHTVVELGLGARGGVNSVQYDWNGGPPPPRRMTNVSLSPMLAVHVEVGGAALRPRIGVVSAPLFFHDLSYDVVTAPILLGSLGLSVGTDAVRVAPHVEAGFLDWDAGVSLLVRDVRYRPRTRLRSGVELGVDYYSPRGVAIGLMYSLVRTWPTRDQLG